jgi:hypothetical protein
MRYMKTITTLALACLTTLLVSAAEPNATGTWKWTFTLNNGDAIEPVLKLKQEGQKLTGTVQAREQEAKIEDGKITPDGKVSFKVNRERDGQTTTIKYEGKLEGDVIKGKSESNFSGEWRTRDWEAKREKSVAAKLDGEWTSTISLDDGNTFDMQLKLKQEGSKLSGTLTREGGTERKLQEGTLKDNQVNFVVKGEREGRAITSKYTGKLEGQKIKGTVTSDYTGESRTMQWEAKKQ